MRGQTKLEIQESFRGLLRVKSLDRITVRDIVEDCGLTRNTFYYHYEDIYDLFDDYLDTQMRQVLQARSENGAWEDTLERFLLSIFDTPRTGRHVFFSKKRDTLRQYLNKMLSSVLDRYIWESGQDIQVSAEDRRLICDTCCHALYGLLEQWLTGPDSPLLRENLHRVTACFDGAIRQALSYCAEHPGGKESEK
ncbi:MAG: TetR/AcrR family transcriptional regulator C-terminal domain-containing protein [Oscillospiraceae bacterium]|nr:TetR/AcrR family transcriptional regulator C-terminal domain-containing protein [Oscillospiraceae bacterium]